MILTSTCISGVNQGSIADLHQDIRRDASPTGRLFGMSNSDPIRSAFDQLPLKEMDAATLVFAIESAVDELAISGETLRLAMEVATLAHLDQFRKNGIKSDEDPYIVHPLRNVLRLLRYGCSDVEILSATALHDTVEDRPHAVIALLGGQTADDMSASEAQERASTLIASRFGHRISELVEAVTNPIDYPCGQHHRRISGSRHPRDSGSRSIPREVQRLRRQRGKREVPERDRQAEAGHEIRTTRGALQADFTCSRQRIAPPSLRTRRDCKAHRNHRTRFLEYGPTGHKKYSPVVPISNNRATQRILRICDFVTSEYSLSCRLHYHRDPCHKSEFHCTAVI